MGTNVLKSNGAKMFRADNPYKHPRNVNGLHNVNAKSDTRHEAENVAVNETDAAYSDITHLEHRNIGTYSYGSWDNNVDRDDEDEQMANVDQIKLPQRTTRMKLDELTPEHVYLTEEQSLDYMVRPISPSTLTPRNYWTFRNENNLRIPCMADVLGSPYRNDAQKR